jgi:NADPH:quinone reductase-like Zn-dependent oxidoreductase
VLANVIACSLNFRDLGIVRGTYRMPVRDNIVPLSDGAGEVVEVGDGVTRVKVGDKVAGCFFQRWSGGEAPPDVQASALSGSIDGMLAEYVVLEEEGVSSTPVRRRRCDVALRRSDGLARLGRTREGHCRPDRPSPRHGWRLYLRAATGPRHGPAGRHHVIER